MLTRTVVPALAGIPFPRVRETDGGQNLVDSWSGVFSGQPLPACDLSGQGTRE